MLIKDIFLSKTPVISFEIFPPKREYPIETVYETIESLNKLKPDFISVTYGAGGSSRDRTVEIASTIKNKYGIEALAHLTCLSSSKEDIQTILMELRQNQVENILALRGDIPSEGLKGEPYFNFAKELVSFIKSEGGFCIGAAAYPEGHVECASLDKDIQYLQEKVQCGVDFLITQLFFDNKRFYEYKDKLVQKGINVPVMAGIMPVLNKNQIKKMVSLSGASLPNNIIRILDKYEHSPEALREAGIAYATEQIIDLLSWGADGIHIYTMNKPDVADTILNNLSQIRSVLTKENHC
ncbi:MAG TPA: methylenetetrahydrofolate reductase [NAD(P)H] [Thermoanaerobacterales bacterium]|nr:methylenetetrahydrofolate reductase [NAD(P)H] [Thermoanaerobacterales bacterium]